MRHASLLCFLAALGCTEHELSPAAELVSQSEDTTRFCRNGDPKLDLLFVIDDSASMAQEAVRLAENLRGFANLFLAPGSCPFELRVAVTTTSTCSGDAGALVTGSCRERIADFVVAESDEGPAADVRDSACRDVCPLDALEVEPSPVEGSSATSARPWLQWGRFGNLPAEIDLADALSCALPVGLTGCTDETPLAALQSTLQRSRDPNDPQYGFLRSDASLFVVIVADEDDPQADASSYIEMMRDLEAQKREVSDSVWVRATVIAGVGIGYGWNGDDAVLGCEVNEQLVGPTPNLVAFANAMMDDPSEAATSVCEADYVRALSSMFARIFDPPLQPFCIPFCLADGDPSTPELDPVCHARRTENVSDAGIAETLQVPLHPCLPDGAGGFLPPPGELRCLDVIGHDELSEECLLEGWNGSIRTVSIAPSLPAGDTCIEVTCQLSLTPDVDCPAL